MNADDDLLERKNIFSLLDKKRLLFLFTVVLVVAVIWLMVKVTNPQKDLAPKPTLSPLSIDTTALGDDEFERFQLELATKDEVDAGQEEEISRLRDTIQGLESQIEGNMERYIAEIKSAATDQMEGETTPTPTFRYPDPPAKVSNRNIPAWSKEAGQFTGGDTPIEINSDRLVGGLGWISGTPEPQQPEKKTEKYYLPPSFFNAKLLTGIDALTNKQGKENVETIFFMVDAPAVLPNYIKKDLSGCFVVANAHGNLAKERVQVQAVNLSCLSSDGQSVIDEEILGFVTDEGDGKRDLAGNVVSKDASKLGWAFAASVIGEVGNSVSLSSFEQNQNVLGTSTVLNTDRLGERAIGSSIQSGAETYKEIIMDYIKQSGPVVEIGPLKKATIFLQKGVWLEVTTREESNNV